MQSEGLVLVQLGCDIWIPLGCISSAHIENDILQQREAFAILNGRRSIYNDLQVFLKANKRKKPDNWAMSNVTNNTS